jgi:hypothetical protein
VPLIGCLFPLCSIKRNKLTRVKILNTKQEYGKAAFFVDAVPIGAAFICTAKPNNG